MHRENALRTRLPLRADFKLAPAIHLTAISS
jgi:hypothetical protein